jgi:hypothetical protein
MLDQLSKGSIRSAFLLDFNRPFARVVALEFDAGLEDQQGGGGYSDSGGIDVAV